MGNFRGTPNRNGRTKGSTNKATAEIKEAFKLLIENNLPQMEEDLRNLEPFQRLKMITELSSYILPKMKAIEIEAPTINENNELINKLLSISDADFNKIYENE